MSQLGVWVNGTLAATWSTEGGHTLTYDPRWAQSTKARALSQSLPITALHEVRGDAVVNYFDNLLPDSDALRQRLRVRHAARSTDAFDLLAAVGRDCVGAVQLLPHGTQPLGFDRLEYVALSDAEIEMNLRNPADVVAALPGTQEKSALLRVQGRWCRPVGATPTTHLLKLPVGTVAPDTRGASDFTNAVENEWLCAQIARELGLAVAPTRMATFVRQRALIVDRFDRAWSADGSAVSRLSQEDFCQATGTPSHLKYEADGGPGLARCLALLGGSESAAEDRQQFVLAQLAFWLLAVTDGHAKNFSLFLRPEGRYRMTPLYGLRSAWPAMSAEGSLLPYAEARLAMALPGKTPLYRFDSLRARHWKELALRTGGPAVWLAMQAMVEKAPAVLDRLRGRLDGHFPAPVWAPVDAGVRRHAALFTREAGAA